MSSLGQGSRLTSRTLREAANTCGAISISTNTSGITASRNLRLARNTELTITDTAWQAEG